MRWIALSCLLVLGCAEDEPQEPLLPPPVPDPQTLAIQKLMNKVATPPPYIAGEQARALHGRLRVADLHADPLMWPVDLIEKHDYGHVDLPRLEEGNVALQVFATVSQVPLIPNHEENSDDTDLLLKLVEMQEWPEETYTSRLARTLYEADKLTSAVARSKGKLQQIRTAADLERLLEARAGDPGRVGALLGIEGVHALEGELSNLDEVFAKGVRVLGLAHFIDNEFAGSASGMEKGGLSALGRELVRAAQAKGMVIDLAHSSPKTFDDVLAISSAPVIVSHTGIVGHHDDPRNISDAHARGVADTGGVVGIAYFEATVGAATVDAVCDGLAYAVQLVGVDHVALGSDFDGGITAPFDTTGLALVTEGLQQRGLSDEEIAKVMGENTLRVLRAVLP